MLARKRRKKEMKKRKLMRVNFILGFQQI